MTFSIVGMCQRTGVFGVAVTTSSIGVRSRCFILLPEEIFDLDFPSHYFRRSKSVSITLPCTLHGYRKLQCCDAPPLSAPSPTGLNAMTLARVNQYGGLHCSQKDVAALGIEVVPTDPPVRWQLQMARPGGGNLQEDPVKKVIEAVE